MWLPLWLLAPRTTAAQEDALGARPKLVVVIVVDQMRADYVERFRSEWHGGLARLVDRGAWFANASYPYSGTETCPGHATIATGEYPHIHGIIGNTWWDRTANGQLVTCTQDSAERDLGAEQDRGGRLPPSDCWRLLLPNDCVRHAPARARWPSHSRHAPPSCSPVTMRTRCSGRTSS